MSITRRSSSSPPQTDLKHRVITCLNKLSDRDTLTVATLELESIAKNLTNDAFSPFLSCLSATDSAEKSPVRRQCVRLIGLLSAAHGDALSPHLSKMLSAVLRRLRDPDSAVRSACVDAVSSMASQITRPPFSSFLKPLVEAISMEQDHNSQIGSSLCLAAAIEASPNPDPAQLQKLLPRLLKLLRSDSFKAKPALLSLIGSIVSAGGASSRNVLNCLVPCLIEFLSSEDWAARKAAAEGLTRLAVAERSLLMEFKSSCLASLESRRFDKVKVVRDTMNRCLEFWKEVPGVSDEVSPQSKFKSSSKVAADNVGNGGSCPVAKSSDDASFKTPKPKEITSRNRLLSPDNSMSTITPKSSLLRSSHKKPIAPTFCRLGSKQHSDLKFEISVPEPSSLRVAYEDDFNNISESRETESCMNLKPETRRILFNKTSGEKLHKFGGLRSGSRVVPFLENDDCNLDMVDSSATEDLYGNHKDFEDLSLIRKQLVQIENQQSSLLDLLQRFMGSSQCGINSLETRVDGIEKALDEISKDLAVSSGRVSNTDSAENTCCMLPGAEFLSPKFWRRTEGHFSSSRFSFPGKDANAEFSNLDSPRYQQQSRGESVVRPLADTHRGILEKYSNRTPKNMVRDCKDQQACNAVGTDGTSLVNSITPANLSSRSFA